MHELVVLHPHPDDPAAFASSYGSTHLPLAAQLPGMLAWRYSLEVHAEPHSPYFAVFDADFPDAAAMSSPQGRIVQQDVPNYATGGAIVLDYPVVSR